MKAKLTRNDLEAAPAAPEDQTELRPTLRNGQVRPVRFWKEGAVVRHPLAYKLVRQGVAEPADEECAKAADRTPEQIAAARHAYERQSRGIAPQDFDRYEKGFISRLRPDGSYEPGPNAHLEDADDDEDSEDE